MLLNEGEVIHDKYEIDRFLGEGAFAEVYRVKHKFLGRQAMKIFKLPCTSQEEIEDKLSEAITLSRIGHPNIVRVFDAGIVQTHLGTFGYFTMEYVAGGNLETFWRAHESGFVHVSDDIEIIRQICGGLTIAHAEQPPIIHRDIKPQNILIGYDSKGLRVRVADFGLAKKVNPLTLIASAGGTPAFKPPEALRNVDSCAGDVWAIGAILYLLLTDHLPFPIHSMVEFSSGKCWKEPLIPASRHNIQVDSSLDAIISRALAIKSKDRYHDAAAMLEDLTNYKPSQCEHAMEIELSTEKSSTVLGSSPRNDNSSAIDMALNAVKLSQDATKLMEAADLLEEALNRDPELRIKYEYRLKLWRQGITI